MKVRFVCAAVCALFVCTSAFAQKREGQMGHRETTAQIMLRARNDVVKLQGKYIEAEGPDRSRLPVNPQSPATSQWPPAAPPNILEALGKPPSSLPPFTLGVSWTGATLNESGFIPPDSQGAIGPTQFLMFVNGRIKVFDKNGVLGALNVDPTTFFEFPSGGQDVGDPRVRYDRLSQRWFLLAINFTASNNRVVLAVSDGPTITASTVWTFFYFQQNAAPPAGDNGKFADWPTLGVDANALYIGCNMYNLPDVSHDDYWFAGTSAWVVRKSSVLGPGPIFVTAFRNLTVNETGAGPFAPMGVDNDDPTSSVGYIIGVDNATFGTMMIRRIINPGGAPLMSPNVPFTVPATSYPIAVSQLGTAYTLDGIDDRLFSAQIRTNRLTGAQTIWTAHSIGVDSSGVATGSANRNGTRWYQIGNIDTIPTVVQSGTIYDSSAVNPRSYWMSTVAMSGQGHMGAGFSYSGAADRAGAGFTGRFAGDPLGTTQGNINVISGASTYVVQPGFTVQRWGDYSMTTVDPLDDMSMWSIQEFVSSTNVWGVRIFKMVAPPPAAIVSLSPNNANAGATLNVVVTGSSSAGSGFFDPGLGFNRLQAAFGGSGITVNSVTFNNPTQATLNITVAGSASGGVRSLTMTNPDGQASTNATAFTVNGGPANVVPTTYNAVRGVLVAGGVGDLALSDNVFFGWRPGPILSPAEAPIDVTIEGTSPVLTPSQVEFTFEARATTPNIGQRLYMFNNTTNSWEQVDFRTSTTSDSVVTVNVAANAARFVNASTGAIRARFAYKPTGPVLSFPWNARVDQAVWLVTP
jgi:hypothetical protein